jgi:MFS family permease
MPATAQVSQRISPPLPPARAARAASDDEGARGAFIKTASFACLAMLVSYLPFAAVNAALGAIAHSTHAQPSDLQWVTDAFAVALAGVVLSAGGLSDRFGRRRMTLLGLGLTAVGCAVGLGSHWLPSGVVLPGLWVGQGLAGTGAGLVMSSTLALAALAAPTPGARANVIAAWSAAITGALGGGPFITAAIAAHFSWYWVFVPLGLFALGALAFGTHVAESRASAHGRYDLRGQAAGTAAVAAVAYGLIGGGANGWLSLPAVLGALIGAAALAAFLLAERKAAAPVLPLGLFRSRGFVAAGLAAASVLFSIVGAMFALSLFISRGHPSVAAYALRIAPLFIANGLAGLAAARATGFGDREKLVAGLLVAGAGAATFATAASATGLPAIAWRMALFGAGAGVVMATSAAAAVGSVEHALVGVAGSGNNVIRQFGAVLGAAVIGTVYASALHGGGPTHALRLSALVTGGVLLASALAVAWLMPARSPLDFLQSNSPRKEQ